MRQVRLLARSLDASASSSPSKHPRNTACRRDNCGGFYHQCFAPVNENLSSNLLAASEKFVFAQNLVADVSEVIGSVATDPLFKGANSIQ
jgi:hypothetical protein